MSTYQVGDTIEFELAPDRFNSRWNAGGRYDRGATGEWREAKIVSTRMTSLGETELKAETADGDVYCFRLTDYAGYPHHGIRLVRKSRPDGKLRLVDRTDPIAKTRFYATTDRLIDGDRMARELFVPWEERRK